MPPHLPIMEGDSPTLCPALAINLFGGPSIGKTVMAARIFLHLKILGVEAANPEEHAKISIWQGQPHLLDQQLILLGQTWQTLHTLADKVDAVVVDSPLLLCSVYAEGREQPHFHDTVRDFHRRLPRMNLLLSRNPELAYSQSGRREDFEGARSLDSRITHALVQAGESYAILPPVGSGHDDDAAKAVAQRVVDWLESQGRAPVFPPTP